MRQKVKGYLTCYLIVGVFLACILGPLYFYSKQSEYTKQDCMSNSTNERCPRAYQVNIPINNIQLVNYSCNSNSSFDCENLVSESYCTKQGFCNDNNQLTMCCIQTNTTQYCADSDTPICHKYVYTASSNILYESSIEQVNCLGEFNGNENLNSLNEQFNEFSTKNNFSISIIYGFGMSPANCNTEPYLMENISFDDDLHDILSAVIYFIWSLFCYFIFDTLMGLIIQNFKSIKPIDYNFIVNNQSIKMYSFTLYIFNIFLFICKCIINMNICLCRQTPNWCKIMCHLFWNTDFIAANIKYDEENQRLKISDI